MKKTMTVRILCLVLFVSMMLGLMPISALAEMIDDTVGELIPDIGNGEDTTEPDDEDDGIPDYSNPIAVTTADELEKALSEGSSAIRIDQDFAIDRTFYVVADTVIIADEPRTLTRAADFGGDIFVVGENRDGTATAEPAILTLGKPDETTASMIVIDGNSQNMTADVVGTVVFVRGGSRADLYHNLTITNHVKVGNEKVLSEEYSLSYPPRIGGAVAIVSSKAEMRIYGGLYSNNRVNDITDSSTDEGTLSSQGGAIYNYGRLEIYGGTFSGNHAGRGGALYNYRTMSIYSADIVNNTASTLGGAIYGPLVSMAVGFAAEETVSPLTTKSTVKVSVSPQATRRASSMTIVRKSAMRFMIAPFVFQSYNLGIVPRLTGNGGKTYSVTVTTERSSKRRPRCSVKPDLEPQLKT